MKDKRLIERWLPIAAIGIESVRERTPMTPFPAPNRLHVWWARRPLVASRAAVLASILAEEASKDEFLKALGIHGDPVKGVALIDRAKRTGVRVDDPYGYERAFKFAPTEAQMTALVGYNRRSTVVLDATAGGGAIPLESIRLGFSAISNDLNPVAVLLQKATIEYPKELGHELLDEFNSLAKDFRSRVEDCLKEYIPQPNEPAEIATTFLWARTISCPYCSGKVPLSPNWRLAPNGTGVKIVTEKGFGPGDVNRHCKFEIVKSVEEQSEGTVADGDAICPFEDCNRTVDGDEVKSQAQAGGMGDQLFAVVCKRKSEVKTKTSTKIKWIKGYRAPTEEDLNDRTIASVLEGKLEEWFAFDIIPNEDVPVGSKTDEAIRYGVKTWMDMFSPRQLVAHGFSAEVFRSIALEELSRRDPSEVRLKALVYLAIALDKLRDYNSRMTRWHVSRETMVNTFDRHDFAFKWSYAEMALLIEGMGFDWALKATGKALKELIEMVGPPDRADMFSDIQSYGGSIEISNGSGASMPHVTDHSVDAIVMDPPYGANVMYAELSDFFYVWLKRTAGLVVPELFTRKLADKEAEAVANKAHFKGQKGAARLADDDYRVKMEGIFAECRRVLKDDGIMTVMFTHKDTGAWDALAMSLMDAGFVITASWPVNTEASGSLHIKDKAAANSTIFLVCRPRGEGPDEKLYWEDVEPEVAKAVRARVGEFQEAGIQGVDLYLASFGPALEAFSRHWPLTRGTPAPEPKKKRRTQADMFEEFDPYAVRPEDALNAARREVKAWRLAKLASTKAQADMDASTAFYVLAWDAFKAVTFPYDEALRLARAVGADLEGDIIGRLAEKKASDVKLWDSATRMAKGAIGPVDGARGMIDALHHAAHIVRTRGVESAIEALDKAGVAHEDEFKVALEALLEVLPPSKTFSGIEADKAVKPAADDFDALEKLRRIAYADEIGAPDQLELFREFLEEA
jgi:adenine-specific DNA methylase